MLERYSTFIHTYRREFWLAMFVSVLEVILPPQSIALQRLVLVFIVVGITFLFIELLSLRHWASYSRFNRVIVIVCVSISIFLSIWMIVNYIDVKRAVNEYLASPKTSDTVTEYNLRTYLSNPNSSYKLQIELWLRHVMPPSEPAVCETYQRAFTHTMWLCDLADAFAQYPFMTRLSWARYLLALLGAFLPALFSGIALWRSIPLYQLEVRVPCLIYVVGVLWFLGIVLCWLMFFLTPSSPSFQDTITPVLTLPH
jgi:hypothetical protein